MKLKQIAIFSLILIVGAYFRLHGVNWDQNQHLHPDERFLTMVSNDISWPHSIHEYFDTSTSPLNPHNKNYPFFVYGTFPIFFTKLIAQMVHMDDYGGLTIVGRVLSALFDVGTMIIVFLTASEITTTIMTSHQTKTESNKKTWISPFPFLTMFFYGVSVLPIQLSHFYAVDTYLTFFITFSFYLLTRILLLNNEASPAFVFRTILLGITFGLALASKISAIYFSPILFLGFLYLLFLKKKLKVVMVLPFVFLIVTYFSLRIAQPYLFAHPNVFDVSINSKIVDNWKQLKSFDNPNGYFPPGVQWITTKPYIFPLKNFLFWGMGLPLGVLSLSSVTVISLTAILQFIKRKNYFSQKEHFIVLLMLSWVLCLFIYQGSQFVKAMRYFFPLYPFLCLLSAWLFSHINTKKLTIILLCLFTVVFLLIYPISFLSIYNHDNSRIQASEWIYQNIPKGSSLSSEVWDDPLPLNLLNNSNGEYKGVSFPLYDMDNEKKWQEMADKLDHTDYIILSSNRLYGSILTIPQRYPLTSRYYHALFDGSLGFEKVAEFTSRPTFPIPLLHLCLTPPGVRYGIVARKTQECLSEGISFVDDYADETFTVYDHPKVSIFKKIKTVDYTRFFLSK